MRRFFILIVCSLVFKACLVAQIVNIENRRIYDDTLGWSGVLDGNFSIMQNKELLLNGGFRPRVQFKTQKNYFLILTEWLYSKSPTVVYANSGMMHFRYAYRLPSFAQSKKGSCKWESYVQMQYNQLLDQRIRALAGTGLRWKSFESQKWRIFLGSSVLFEHEEFRSKSSTIRDVRWSNYLSFLANFAKEVSISSTIYAQPVIQDFNDVRYMSQVTFSVGVFKRTDLRFEFNHFYDAFPPAGVRKLIFNGTLGFRVKLGE